MAAQRYGKHAHGSIQAREGNPLVEVMTPVTMLGRRAIAAATGDEERDRSKEVNRNMAMTMGRNLEN